jgi:hypothetical protein
VAFQSSVIPSLSGDERENATPAFRSVVTMRRALLITVQARRLRASDVKMT